MKSSANITLLALSVAAPLLLAACSQQPVQSDLKPVKPIAVNDHSYQANDETSYDPSTEASDTLDNPLNNESDKDLEPDTEGLVTNDLEVTTDTDITLAYQMTAEEEESQTSRPAQHLFLFGFDKRSLNEEAIKQVKSHGEFLAEHPSLTLTIKGHADSQGNPVYNEHLALERAQHVASLLIAAGARQEQIEIISFGSSEPLPNATNYKDNRRVEIVYGDEYYVRNGEEF